MLLKTVALVVVFAFLGNSIVWAEPSHVYTNLSVGSRLKPFFEEHGLGFMDLYAVASAVAQLRELNNSTGIRESHIMNLNKLFSPENVSIDPQIRERKFSATQRTYSYATFYFGKEKKPIEVRFVKDHESLTGDELLELGVRTEEDKKYFSPSGIMDILPKLDGVWFVDPERAEGEGESAEVQVEVTGNGPSILPGLPVPVTNVEGEVEPEVLGIGERVSEGAEETELSIVSPGLAGTYPASIRMLSDEEVGFVGEKLRDAMNLQPFSDKFADQQKGYIKAQATLDGLCYRIGPMVFVVMRKFVEHPYVALVLAGITAFEEEAFGNALGQTYDHYRNRISDIFELYPGNIFFIPPYYDIAGQALNAYDVEMLQWMIAFRDVIRGATVLDAGSGAGVLSSVALGLGASRVVLIDNSEQRLNAADVLLRKPGYGLENYTILNADLTKTEGLIDLLKEYGVIDAITVCLANIGPWPHYCNANVKTALLAGRYLRSLKLLINSGYAHQLSEHSEELERVRKFFQDQDFWPGIHTRPIGVASLTAVSLRNKSVMHDPREGLISPAYEGKTGTKTGTDTILPEGQGSGNEEDGTELSIVSPKSSLVSLARSLAPIVDGFLGERDWLENVEECLLRWSSRYLEEGHYFKHHSGSSSKSTWSNFVNRDKEKLRNLLLLSLMAETHIKTVMFEIFGALRERGVDISLDEIAFDLIDDAHNVVYSSGTVTQRGPYRNRFTVNLLALKDTEKALDQLSMPVLRHESGHLVFDALHGKLRRYLTHLEWARLFDVGIDDHPYIGGLHFNFSRRPLYNTSVDLYGKKRSARAVIAEQLLEVVADWVQFQLSTPEEWSEEISRRVAFELARSQADSKDHSVFRSARFSAYARLAGLGEEVGDISRLDEYYSSTHRETFEALRDDYAKFFTGLSFRRIDPDHVAGKTTDSSSSDPAFHMSGGVGSNGGETPEVSGIGDGVSERTGETGLSIVSPELPQNVPAAPSTIDRLIEIGAEYKRVPGGIRLFSGTDGRKAFESLIKEDIRDTDRIIKLPFWVSTSQEFSKNDFISSESANLYKLLEQGHDVIVSELRNQGGQRIIFINTSESNRFRHPETDSGYSIVYHTCYPGNALSIAQNGFYALPWRLTFSADSKNLNRNKVKMAFRVPNYRLLIDQREYSNKGSYLALTADTEKFSHKLPDEVRRKILSDDMEFQTITFAKELLLGGDTAGLLIWIDPQCIDIDETLRSIQSENFNDIVPLRQLLNSRKQGDNPRSTGGTVEFIRPIETSPRVVIWDWDRTLFETLETVGGNVHEALLAEIYSIAYGGEKERYISKGSEKFKDTQGMTNIDRYNMVMNELIDEGRLTPGQLDPAEYTRRGAEIMTAHVKAHMEEWKKDLRKCFVPGSLELVRELHKRKVKQYVSTGNPWLTKEIVDELGIGEYFEGVFSSISWPGEGEYSKAEAFKFIAARHEAKDIMVIGDGNVELELGRALDKKLGRRRVYTVALLYPPERSKYSSSEEAIRNADPDVIIHGSSFPDAVKLADDLNFRNNRDDAGEGKGKEKTPEVSGIGYRVSESTEGPELSIVSPKLPSRYIPGWDVNRVRKAITGGITYEEAVEWRKWKISTGKRFPSGFWQSKQTVINYIFATLDTIPGFKDARQQKNIAEMARLYRDNVIGYSGGQKKFFYDEGGLRGLMVNNYEGYLSKFDSPAAILRLVLPDLINIKNPDALDPLEVDQSYWNDPENARYHIFEALDNIPNFARARENHDVLTMASLYRENVINYKTKDGKYGNGQVAFFYDEGGLLGLMCSPRAYLGKTGSPASLLRFAIPELVDPKNPDALRLNEIERKMSQEESISSQAKSVKIENGDTIHNPAPAFIMAGGAGSALAGNIFMAVFTYLYLSSQKKAIVEFFEAKSSLGAWYSPAARLAETLARNLLFDMKRFAVTRYLARSFAYGPGLSIRVIDETEGNLSLNFEYGLTYEEAVEWRRWKLKTNKRFPGGFWGSGTTAYNYVLATLDSIPGFRKARKENEIAKMAELYREHVIGYNGGQQKFFSEQGGMGSLMANRPVAHFSKVNSPAAVIRFVLPELLDAANPEALDPSEVELNYWNDPENAKRHILEALDRVPGFAEARGRSDIGEMADLYRKYVIKYRAKSAKYDNGQAAFFSEKSGLGGILSHHRAYLDRQGSPASLLRFAIPELVDKNDKSALRSDEIERVPGSTKIGARVSDSADEETLSIVSPELSLFDLYDYSNANTRTVILDHGNSREVDPAIAELLRKINSLDFVEATLSSCSSHPRYGIKAYVRLLYKKGERYIEDIHSFENELRNIKGQNGSGIAVERNFDTDCLICLNYGQWGEIWEVQLNQRRLEEIHFLWQQLEHVVDDFIDDNPGETIHNPAPAFIMAGGAGSALAGNVFMAVFIYLYLSSQKKAIVEFLQAKSGLGAWYSPVVRLAEFLARNLLFDMSRFAITRYVARSLAHGPGLTIKPVDPKDTAALARELRESIRAAWPDLVERYDAQQGLSSAELDALRDDIYGITQRQLNIWGLSRFLKGDNWELFGRSWSSALIAAFPGIGLDPLGFKLDWTSPERGVASVRYVLSREIPHIIKSYDSRDSLSPASLDHLRRTIYEITLGHFRAWGLIGVNHRAVCPYFNGSYIEALSAVFSDLGLDPLGFQLDWSDRERAIASIRFVLESKVPDIIRRYDKRKGLSAGSIERLKRDIYHISSVHFRAWGLSGIEKRNKVSYFNGRHSDALAAVFPELGLDPLGFSFDWSTPENGIASIRFVLRREMPSILDRYDRIDRLDEASKRLLRRDITAILSSQFQSWGLSGAFDSRVAPYFGGYRNALLKVFDSPALGLTMEDFEEFRRGSHEQVYRWNEGVSGAIANVRDAIGRFRPSIIKRYDSLSSLSPEERETLKEDVYAITRADFLVWKIAAGIGGSVPYFKGSYIAALRIVFPELELDPLGFRLDWSSDERAMASVRYVLKREIPEIVSLYETRDRLRPDEVEALRDQIYRISLADIGIWGIGITADKKRVPFFRGSYSEVLMKAFPGIGLVPYGFHLDMSDRDSAIASVRYVLSREVPDIVGRYDKRGELMPDEEERLREEIYRLKSAHFTAWRLGSLLSKKSVPFFNGRYADVLIAVFPDIGLDPLGFELDWSSKERALASVRFIFRRKIPSVMSRYDAIERLSMEEINALRGEIACIDQSDFNFWGLSSAGSLRRCRWFGGSYKKALLETFDKPKLDLASVLRTDAHGSKLSDKETTFTEDDSDESTHNPAPAFIMAGGAGSALAGNVFMAVFIHLYLSSQKKAIVEFLQAKSGLGAWYSPVARIAEWAAQRALLNMSRFAVTRYLARALAAPGLTIRPVDPDDAEGKDPKLSIVSPELSCPEFSTSSTVIDQNLAQELISKNMVKIVSEDGEEFTARLERKEWIGSGVFVLTINAKNGQQVAKIEVDNNEIEESFDVAHGEAIFVLSEYRRRHIGTALIVLAMNIAKILGHENFNVYGVTKGSEKEFYKNIGFEERPRIEDAYEFDMTKKPLPSTVIKGIRGKGEEAVRPLFHEQSEMKQHGRTVPSDSEGEVKAQVQVEGKVEPEVSGIEYRVSGRAEGKGGSAEVQVEVKVEDEPEVLGIGDWVSGSADEKKSSIVSTGFPRALRSLSDAIRDVIARDRKEGVYLALERLAPGELDELCAAAAEVLGDMQETERILYHVVLSEPPHSSGEELKTSSLNSYYAEAASEILSHGFSWERLNTMNYGERGLWTMQEWEPSGFSDLPNPVFEISFKGRVIDAGVIIREIAPLVDEFIDSHESIFGEDLAKPSKIRVGNFLIEGILYAFGVDGIDKVNGKLNHFVIKNRDIIQDLRNIRLVGPMRLVEEVSAVRVDETGRVASSLHSDREGEVQAQVQVEGKVETEVSGIGNRVSGSAESKGERAKVQVKVQVEDEPDVSSIEYRVSGSADEEKLSIVSPELPSPELPEEDRILDIMKRSQTLGKIGYCLMVSVLLAQNLKDNGFDAWVMAAHRGSLSMRDEKNQDIVHFWVETPEYIFDAFPEGLGAGSVRKSVMPYEIEGHVIIPKGSPIPRIYAGGRPANIWEIWGIGEYPIGNPHVLFPSAVKGIILAYDPGALTRDIELTADVAARKGMMYRREIIAVYEEIKVVQEIFESSAVVLEFQEEDIKNEARGIHDENLKFTPTVSRGKILCHIVADSVVTPEQIHLLKVDLEQGMRGDEYKEKIVALQVLGKTGHDEFIAELEEVMRKVRDNNKGYDVDFTVACPDIEGLVEKLQGEGLNALAFRKEGDGNIVQVEGILLALRALSTESIEKLLHVYNFLTGKNVEDLPENINELAKKLIFTMYVRKAGMNEDKKINDLIRDNILTAA